MANSGTLKFGGPLRLRDASSEEETDMRAGWSATILAIVMAIHRRCADHRPRMGGTEAAWRFFPPAQINPGNVGKLRKVWQVHHRHA